MAAFSFQRGVGHLGSSLVAFAAVIRGVNHKTCPGTTAETSAGAAQRAYADIPLLSLSRRRRA